MNQKLKSRLLLVGFMGSFLIIFFLLFQYWGSYLKSGSELTDLPVLAKLNQDVLFFDSENNSVSFKPNADKISILSVSHHIDQESVHYTYSVLLDLHGSLKRRKTGHIVSLIIGDSLTQQTDHQKQMNDYWKPDLSIWTIARISQADFSNLILQQDSTATDINTLQDNYIYLVDKNGFIRGKYSIDQTQLTAKVITDISLLLRKEKQ